MNAEIRFKDKRLLEALEYIDDKYIEDVFNVLKEPKSAQKGYVKQSTFKQHWKQYLAAAACILLLALVTPLMSFIPEIINSFAAGWGEVDETTTEPLSTHLTEPLNLDPYSINQAELDQINAAWAKYVNDENAIYSLNPEDIHYISGGSSMFFGKYNGCIFLYRAAATCISKDFEINGNIFRGTGTFWVCKDGEPYHWKHAYENGWISDKDIEDLYTKYTNRNSNQIN